MQRQEEDLERIVRQGSNGGKQHERALDASATPAPGDAAAAAAARAGAGAGAGAGANTGVLVSRVDALQHGGPGASSIVV